MREHREESEVDKALEKSPEFEEGGFGSDVCGEKLVNAPREAGWVITD